jgi:Tol biopolymer transport system component/predicted Ser/Thr protein kinase
MSLTPGTRLGPYEILAPLGAGGMGEVFRAKDTRLGREVAIKVVPDLLAGEPEVRARFEREARAASALNHPHICQVYDVGREGDVDYIVMELIEGESLAQRLEKGPMTPVETLRVSGQVADALDRAHRAGIVHRDLKPGNIMLTKQGAKLLDFGLARPTGLGGPGSGSRAPGTPSSPTMSRPLTAAGSIVGTFRYMAPEQLEGAEADARSDIWALGATMYEMATGKPAFVGKSQASLIAAILSSDPRPIAEIVPLAPPALDRLVRACLAKDPEERIQTAHDVKLQLKWIAEGGSQAGVPAPVAAHRRRREKLAWIVAGVASVIALAALGWSAMQAFGPKPARHAVRFVITAPAGMTGITWPRLSPDGTMLAFMARDSSGSASIWVRPLSTTVAYQLQGTSGAGRPFWSPDSRELGFFADSKFKKIAAAGGPLQLVGDAGNASDGAWSREFVLFDASVSDSIRAMPVTGGAVIPVSTLDRARGETQHAWPFALPDGKHFLFQSFRGGRRESLIRLGTLGKLESVIVDSSDSRAEFLPPDHLVYVKDGAVIARRFDLGRAKVVGNPIVIGENAGSSVNTEAFTVSSNGGVAFQSSNTGSALIVLRYDRTGKALGPATPAAPIGGFAVSPDGQRMALSISEGGSSKADLWIRDLRRGTQTRFTFDPGDDIWPVWSPRGDTIAFSSDRAGDYSVMIKPVSGVSEETPLPGLKITTSGPTQYSADGKFLFVCTRTSRGDWDSYAVPLADSAHPIPIATTPFDDLVPRLSPDGRFVSFSSAESGISQIYVQAFPKPNGRWQISVNGGQHAFWTLGGKELVFRAQNGDLMAVPVSNAPNGGLDPGNPTRLFGGLQGGGFPGRWGPAVDGKEFLALQPANFGRTELYPITVILDANADLAGK